MNHEVLSEHWNCCPILRLPTTHLKTITKVLPLSVLEIKITNEYSQSRSLAAEF